MSNILYRHAAAQPPHCLVSLTSSNGSFHHLQFAYSKYYRTAQACTGHCAMAQANPLRRTHATPSKKNYMFWRHFPWKCCKVFCASVRTCVLRVTTKKVVNFFCILEFAPPPWKKSCGRPWLLLMAQPLKHRQSYSGTATTGPRFVAYISSWIHVQNFRMMTSLSVPLSAYENQVRVGQKAEASGTLKAYSDLLRQRFSNWLLPPKSQNICVKISSQICTFCGFRQKPRMCRHLLPSLTS